MYMYVLNKNFKQFAYPCILQLCYIKKVYISRKCCPDAIRCRLHKILEDMFFFQAPNENIEIPAMPLLKKLYKNFSLKGLFTLKRKSLDVDFRLIAKKKKTTCLFV